MAATSPVELTCEQITLIAKALADPRRYAILKQIGSCDGGQTSCASMRSCVEVSPATLSHHMKELETAGLIRATRDGKFMHYKLQAPILRAYLHRLKSDLI